MVTASALDKRFLVSNNSIGILTVVARGSHVSLEPLEEAKVSHSE